MNTRARGQLGSSKEIMGSSKEMMGFSQMRSHNVIETIKRRYCSWHDAEQELSETKKNR